MKDLIIIMFSIVLGVYIYNAILGEEPDTIRSASRTVMEGMISEQQIVP